MNRYILRRCAKVLYQPRHESSSKLINFTVNAENYPTPSEGDIDDRFDYDESILSKHKRALRSVIDLVRGIPAEEDDTLGHVTDYGMPWLGECVEKVAPSVVNVIAADAVHGEVVTKNDGAGVIVNADGTIVTAFDLVANQSWLFGRPWTPKRHIIVGLSDGRRLAANIAIADKGLGIAVLKISPEHQLTAAFARFPYYTCHNESLINVKWPPIKSNSLVASVRSITDDAIHLVGQGHSSSSPPNKESFGGPIINYHGEVLGITQKISPEDDQSFFATPIGNAMRLVEKLK